MKNTAPWIIFGLVIILTVFLIFMPKKANGLPKDPVLFVGEGCSHCEEVEKFVEENKILEKYNFSTLETFKNTDNAIIMSNVWKHCGLYSPDGQMGVPLFWDGSTCYQGSDEIKNFLKNKSL
jgi:hypothetical protein